MASYSRRNVHEFHWIWIEAACVHYDRVRYGINRSFHGGRRGIDDMLISAMKSALLVKKVLLIDSSPRDPIVRDAAGMDRAVQQIVSMIRWS
jgi:hypothetical protein